MRAGAHACVKLPYVGPGLAWLDARALYSPQLLGPWTSATLCSWSTAVVFHGRLGSSWACWGHASPACGRWVRARLLRPC
eukprot:7027564-Alexandrium_andersonii.AAC.1